MKKIDVFNHIWPRPFYDALIAHLGTMTDITRRSEAVPMMVDIDRRMAVMDMFGPDYMQILSLASPPLELIASPEVSVSLARIGSDLMAELCAKHPRRFPGFVGTVPISHADGMISESRHAIEELGALGMQVYTNVSGKPLDAPEFLPFFQYMAEMGKPVWLHPSRGERFADYSVETRSEYEIWWALGWPYDTSAAMARLVFSGVFDKCPGLKVITHHGGGMIPFFEGRVGAGWDQLGKRTSDRDLASVLGTLQRPHLEYFKEFYADTATFGSRKAIEHAAEFFGADRVLFASDAPFDPEGGPMYIRETINCIETANLTGDTKENIFQNNAVKLFGLKI